MWQAPLLLDLQWPIFPPTVPRYCIFIQATSMIASWGDVWFRWSSLSPLLGLPQTPQRKKFLQKLLVKGPGYLPGVCGWDLRRKLLFKSCQYSGVHLHLLSLDSSWRHDFLELDVESTLISVSAMHTNNNILVVAEFLRHSNQNVIVQWIENGPQTKLEFRYSTEKARGVPLKVSESLKRLRPESVCNWDTKEQDTKPAPKNQKIWDLLGSKPKNQLQTRK